MIKLTALKRLRYPRGADAKEYEAGQDFTALSERDAKALTLVRAAKPAGKAPAKPKPAPVEAKVMTATEARSEPVSEAPLEPRKYLRRDLQAKE